MTRMREVIQAAEQWKKLASSGQPTGQSAES